MTQEPAENEPLHIIIRADGQVAFRTLTGAMLEIALCLAPEDPRLRRRRTHGRDAEGAETGSRIPIP